MLTYRTHGTHGPTIFFLHWLGGSALTWTEVAEGLAARGLRCIAIDLPGFGDAANLSGYTLAESAAAVAETIRQLRTAAPNNPWLLGGHSMGGKIAALVARMAVDGAQGLDSLRGMVLTSPSTPEPEPMKESRRAELLETMGHPTGDPEEDRKRAAKMVDGSIGKLPLLPAVRDRSINDILRLNRAAFRAWLEDGSKQDASTTVGVLPIPAIIFAGDSERALGPDTQQNTTLPHFAAGQLTVLEGMGHLAPLERPAELVERIADFVLDLGLQLQRPQVPLSPAFQSLLDSDRTSPQTRSVMQARLALDDNPLPPSSLNHSQLYTLRALVACVIPGAPFDLAARIERVLIAAKGDGWRYDALPGDAHAWSLGLDSLNAAAHHSHGVNFSALTPDLQHDLLECAQNGKLGRSLLGILHLGGDSHLFTAGQMQRWFEDVRAELTRLYVADARTMDRIGFTGFADEGGFTQIELNQREVFEPKL